MHQATGTHLQWVDFLTPSLWIRFCCGSSLVSFPRPANTLWFLRAVIWQSLRCGAPLFSAPMFCATTWLQGHGCGLGGLGQGLCVDGPRLLATGLGAHWFIHRFNFCPYLYVFLSPPRRWCEFLSTRLQSNLDKYRFHSEKFGHKGHFFLKDQVTEAVVHSWDRDKQRVNTLQGP